MGTEPSEKDPKFASWDEQDSMVMSWLWNSMLPENSDTCMFLGSAKEFGRSCDRLLPGLMMQPRFMKLSQRS